MPLYTTQGIFVYRGTEVNKQHIVHCGVTSKAAPRPPVQRGTKISAGRRSAPGSKNLPSLLGPSPALTAVSKKASLKALCLLILSPPVPQQRAWSPMTSLRRRQAGHWAGTLGIVDWQPQPVLDCQNKL